MKGDQRAPLDAPRDRAAADAERDELRLGDDPVLTRREQADACIGVNKRRIEPAAQDLRRYVSADVKQRRVNPRG